MLERSKRAKKAILVGATAQALPKLFEGIKITHPGICKGC
ncbi:MULTISPECIES: hypothetical protein [Thermococcus]|nr:MULTISPECIES: hypothetical protein [Thermococcus]